MPSKDPRARAKFLIASPGPGVSPESAARTILEEFLPRAFRRPVEKAEVDFHLGLFTAASKRGESFEDSILYALRAALISPQFLFRSEPPNTTGQAELLDDYSLASRLSYFLWGSAPDSSVARAGGGRKAERSGGPSRPGGAHAAESAVV